MEIARRRRASEEMYQMRRKTDPEAARIPGLPRMRAAGKAGDECPASVRGREPKGTWVGPSGPTAGVRGTSERLLGILRPTAHGPVVDPWGPNRGRSCWLGPTVVKGPFVCEDAKVCATWHASGTHLPPRNPKKSQGLRRRHSQRATVTRVHEPPATGASETAGLPRISVQTKLGGIWSPCHLVT